MSEVRSTAIPNYLVASSPLGLRQLMFRNNSKHACFFKYDIIFNSKDGRWYAWYYFDITTPPATFNDPLITGKESENGDAR